MELIDVLQKIVSQYVNGADLTGLQIGTVSQTEPLEITVESTRLILPKTVLRLTAAVVEKRMPVLSHGHSGVHGFTSAALTEIACIEHGQPLPVEDGYIILNRGLAVGDKVLMLRVMAGQSYLILSRVY